MTWKRRSRRRAVLQASLASLAVVVAMVFCSWLALQFPLVSEPFTTPYRPVFAVSAATACAWLTVAVCEITLAVRHPGAYLASGPFSGLQNAWISGTRLPHRTLPKYGRQIFVFLLLLGSVPLVITIVGTSIVPIIWTAALAASTPLYIGVTIQQSRD